MDDDWYFSSINTNDGIYKTLLKTGTNNDDYRVCKGQL